MGRPASTRCAPGDVYVFTGPFFGRKRETIGPAQVWVPSHTWKLVYTPADKRAWAYWMTNDGAKQSLKPISYADLVKYSGLRLLPDGAASAKLLIDLTKD
jgi:endonuclease G